MGLGLNIASGNMDLGFRVWGFWFVALGILTMWLDF